MNTLLVTGGAGFIGNCFVHRALTASNCRVVNLDKLTYAGNLAALHPWLDHPRHRLVVGDVCCGQTLAEMFATYRPTAVVHFAAESHVDRSIDSPAEFVQTNVVGTCTLLEAALAYWRELPAQDRYRFRLLHVSTDEVYGSADADACFDESSPYAPNSPYAASKAAADHFVRAYHRTYGLPTLTTHCSNNYGPFQFPEKLIPHMILAAWDRRELPVYGDGQQQRDWLHVDDHCRALELVLERGNLGEVYHVGGDGPRTNLSIVQLICDTIDELTTEKPQRRHELIRFVTDRPGHDRRYAVDSGKLRRSLGWRPTWSFAAGLRATVTWYLKNRAWAESVAEGTYRHERLGLRASANQPTALEALS